MADPIPFLALVPAPVDRALIATIKEILAKAESGQIDGIAFATVGREGPRTHWHNTRTTIEMMAAVAHLQWRYHYESEMRDIEGSAPDGA